MPEFHLQSTIHLAESGDRFELAVSVCPGDHPSLELFSSYVSARARARLLPLEHGWTIDDQCGGKAKCNGH